MKKVEIVVGNKTLLRTFGGAMNARDAIHISLITSISDLAISPSFSGKGQF